MIGRPRRILFGLLLLALWSTGFTQETESEGTPPDLRALESGWWTYFQGRPSEVEPRMAETLERLTLEIADLPPSMQEPAETLLAAVNENATAFLELLLETAPETRQLAEPAASYSIDDLFELAAASRAAQDAATTDQLETERQERILTVAETRRDGAFRDYLDTPEEDERWLAGLRLVQTRLALAIAARRLDLFTERAERSREYAQITATRVELATERLAALPDAAQLAEINRAVAASDAAVEDAEAGLREAEVAAIGLDLETALGRSQARLQQQRLINAQAELGLAKLRQATALAVQWWQQLQLDEDTEIDALAETTLNWSELTRSTALEANEWKSDTEDELLAVQRANSVELERSLRRVLEQRLDAARATLATLRQLDDAGDDLTLMIGIVDTAAARYSGPLVSWWNRFSRGAQSFFLRLGDLAEIGLFNIGDTPVTIGDLFRVAVILTLAFWLSRGVRHALERVGRRDTGTQATLYTVGRLLHYLIIFAALLIALSSIGLDFSNLALIAGALSVGIGFGLQSIVNNFVSGLIILFEQTLRVGDYIELDTGLTGTVKSINVRSTLINTNDNIDIVVPNSEFVNARLTNWTLGERTLRVRIPFGVAYGTDKELVRKAALEAIDKVSYTLPPRRDREPQVRLVEYGDNSLNFLLLVWVNRQGARRPGRTRAAYLWEIETALRKYGIEIPFPQRDLHLRSGWPGQTEGDGDAKDKA